MLRKLVIMLALAGVLAPLSTDAFARWGGRGWGGHGYGWGHRGYGWGGYGWGWGSAYLGADLLGFGFDNGPYYSDYGYGWGAPYTYGVYGCSAPSAYTSYYGYWGCVR